MSNTNPLSVTKNSTLASLNLNTTQSTPLKNSTWIPYNNRSLYPNGNTSTTVSSPWYLNNTNYWNNSIYNPSVYNPYSPYYPNYVTIDPPLITYSYTYSYVYYVLLLLLLIVAIVSIKIGISRRKELERRAAIQRRRALQQSQYGNVPSTNNDNNSSNSGNDNNTTSNTGAKVFDLPPAYDDVVQSYILAKQLEQQSPENNVATGMTTNPSSNNISAAISTLTIESEISNSNHASALNVNNASTSSIMSDTTNITSDAVNPTLPSTSSQPPSYDNLVMELSTIKINNDHIV